MKRLKTSLIVVLCLSGIQLAHPLYAHEFNWENLALAAMKLNKTYDFQANVDGYMQAFRPDVWGKYRDNEFALSRKREETLKIMQDRVAMFSLDEEFVLLARLQFGKYDFTDKGFPVNNLNTHTYWYASGPYAPQFRTYHRVFFSNPDLITFVKMEGQRAEAFVGRNANGANRSVYAKIQFKITAMKLGGDRDALLAELQSATLFEDEQRLKPITEIVKSKEKVVRKDKVIELTIKDKIVAHTTRLTAADSSKNGKRWKLFDVEFEAGKTYRIDAESEEIDSYLVLLDSSGKELASDDDSGGNLNARITYGVLKTGRYRIMVTTYGDGQTTGEFSLTIREKAK